MQGVQPNVKRVAVLRDPTSAAGIGQFSAIQPAAQSLGVNLTPVSVRDAGEIERGVAAFARSDNGGLIVTSGGTAFRRDLIIGLASRHKLTAVYPFRYYAKDGGLITYGPDPRIWSGTPRLTSIASSRVRSQPICRSKRRRPTSL